MCHTSISQVIITATIHSMKCLSVVDTLNMSCVFMIMQTQDILKVSTTLKRFMECIVAVIITQDMDMWHMKCQLFISVLLLFNCPLPLCVMLKSYEWWGSHKEKRPNNERVMSLCNTYLLSRPLSYLQLIPIYLRLSMWEPHHS